MIGKIVTTEIGLQFLDQLEAAHVGQSQIEHHAIESLVLESAQRFLTGGDGRGVNVAVANQFHHAHALHVVVLDHQQFANATFGEVSNVVEGLAEVLMSDGLLHVIERALLAARAGALPRP